MRYHFDGRALLLHGDALNVLKTRADGSVNCVVTSPPYYGLRDYDTPGQYGLEASPAAYVETMRALFAEARRVLADDGTLWLNIGDSYSLSSGGTPGSSAQVSATRANVQRRIGLGDRPRKSLLMIPERVAIALQDDGWILRNKIVWNKADAMPESVRDRLSRRHETIYLFSKSQQYLFDLDAIREPYAPQTKWTSGTGSRMRNPGDVWTFATANFPAAHFATFPVDLPLRCIKAGCKPNGIVLDPFSGAGTTGLAARQLGRRYIGIDLSTDYHDLAIERFETLRKAA